MSNPSQVVAPVVLGPGMSAVEAVQYLREGRTDLEALRAWAMSTVVEMTKENSMALMSSGLSIPDFCEINERQKEFAKRSSKTVDGFRITFSKPGRIVLNGLKLNSNAEGKGGFDFSLFPSQLSRLIDGLPVMLEACIDNAGTMIPGGAMVQEISEAWEKGREAGKSEAQLRSAGVAKFKSVVHPRAGLESMDWSNCDKPATVAKLREVLKALRAIKPAAVDAAAAPAKS